MAEYTAAQKVAIARNAGRPGTADYISALFTDFFEFKGDRQCREDPAILGGVALVEGDPPQNGGVLPALPVPLLLKKSVNRAEM